MAVHAKQTTINRPLQSASASPAQVKKVEEVMKLLKESQEIHRDEAQKSHSYYMEVTAQYAAEWNKITSLEKKGSLTRAEKGKLTRLKNKFNLVICSDFQMCKLVPYWGLSAQHGSTYYLQKLNYDVFRIVNHAL